MLIYLNLIESLWQSASVWLNFTFQLHLVIYWLTYTSTKNIANTVTITNNADVHI